MAERDFLIQRYSSANWPQVRGHVPFYASGPAFKAFAVPGSLERNRMWRFHPTLRSVVEESGADRLAVAEWLLREGIVQALWSVDSRECLPRERRWLVSIEQLAAEIPSDTGVGEAAIELLSGVSDPGHFTLYLSEDGLTLEPVTAP